MQALFRITVGVLILTSSATFASEHGTSPAPSEHAAPEAKGGEQHADEDSRLPVRFARQSSRDVHVPKRLVETMEKEYRAYLQSVGVIDAELVQRRFLNVALDLEQKKAGALFDNVRIQTPLGGGVVDLADFVTAVRGSFQMHFKVTNEEGQTPEGIRFVYISKAERRKIEGEKFGAGCNRYMEISDFINKKNAASGLTMYTAEQRYVSVLAGTFVIFAFTKQALQVASLTITDSRYPKLLCD